MAGSFDTAQICLNGHVTNASSKTFPDANADFCRDCGQPTISACPKCSGAIRGNYNVPGVIVASRYRRPAFCSGCGEPYPWTSRALDAARDLAKDADLSPGEMVQFETSLEAITQDSPSAVAAGSRFKTLLGKVGVATADGIRKVLVDVASETAKKAIWGP
jgi:hypothetical protein